LESPQPHRSERTAQYSSVGPIVELYLDYLLLLLLLLPLLLLVVVVVVSVVGVADFVVADAFGFLCCFCLLLLSLLLGPQATIFSSVVS
jgi:hypothetical protein